MAFWAHLSWPEIRDVARSEAAIVLLPVASIEQHGPHLPVWTDTLIGEALATGVDDGELPIVRLPALCYGKSNEHTDFPGTVTLSAETLLRVLDEVAASVARAGFARLVFLNTHGGNTALLVVAAREVRARHGLMAASFNPMSTLDVRKGKGEVSEPEARYGIHAGQVETSIMLALHPELVRMELASGEPPGVLAEAPHLGFAGANTVAWLAGDLTANGVLGDPSRASADAGRRYLAEAVNATRTALAEFSALRFPGPWATEHRSGAPAKGRFLG